MGYGRDGEAEGWRKVDSCGVGDGDDGFGDGDVRVDGEVGVREIMKASRERHGAREVDSQFHPCARRVASGNARSWHTACSATEMAEGARSALVVGSERCRRGMGTSLTRQRSGSTLNAVIPGCAGFAAGHALVVLESSGGARHAHIG